MTKALLRSCAALALAALPISASAGGIEYTITDLGNNIYPNAINSEGHVTGADGNTSQAFIYNGTTLSDTGVYGVGYAINSSDEIAGSSSVDGNPFIYSIGSGVAYPTFGSGQANGINSSGEVVGSTVSTGAFLYDAGSFTYLSGLAGASDINDHGQITGATYFSGSSSYDAYIYNPDDTVQNLGTLPGATDSYGQAINASGNVAGAAIYSGGSEEAIFWNGSALVGLGTLGGGFSSATSLNDNGQVVGLAYTSSDAIDAFIYSNGVMTDLNSLIDPTLDLTLESANGINDAGQIVAEAETASGQEEGVLLTPVVPVPAALPAGLALLGLVAIVRRRRGRIDGA